MYRGDHLIIWKISVALFCTADGMTLLNHAMNNKVLFLISPSFHRLNFRLFSANISSVRDNVTYGPSVLVSADKKGSWDSGRQMCSAEGGSLAKLDWDSPMLIAKLNEVFGDATMWIGLGPVGWYFNDGT